MLLLIILALYEYVCTYYKYMIFGKNYKEFCHFACFATELNLHIIVITYTFFVNAFLHFYFLTLYV